jgi:hypothetical protein
MWGASPNAVHPWLHAKPLDAAIGRVPAPYCPGGHHGQGFQKKKTPAKHNFYLAFSWKTNIKKLSDLETHQRPSTHVLGATSPGPNPYATSQVEELSYICKWKKNQKVISLNEARETLWCIYAPVVVILLVPNVLQGAW